MFSLDLANDRVVAVASGLLGESLHLVSAGGGGNNRLYRLTSGQNDYALKFYPPRVGDDRDRLGVECQAIAFLQSHGITDVPRLVGWEEKSRCALFHWVEGEPIAAVDGLVAQQMLDFLARIQSLEGVPEAYHLGNASDACLLPMAAEQQFYRRFDRLYQQGLGLSAFLKDELEGVARRVIQEAAERLGQTWRQPLPKTLAMLSLSDFGIHNGLRCRDGRLVFLDLEYFGWDDPVKLTCDLLWHPAMALSPGVALQLRLGIQALRCRDEGFHQRWRALFPLFGLIWCLILLNPFLADGRHGSDLLANRLTKAREYLLRVENSAHD